MNPYDNAIAERKAEAVRARAESDDVRQTREKERSAALAAVRRELETHAKPEFVKARDALVAAGFRAEVELAETVFTPCQSAIIRLVIGSGPTCTEYRAELHGSSAFNISSHLLSPSSESNLGTCHGDLREFAAGLLSKFISTLPA